MGYCMSQHGSNIVIKSEHLPAALAAIKAMYNIVEGQSRPPSFSWVDRAPIEKAETLAQALEEWRWEPHFGDNGDLIDLVFTGEKLGDDPDLFCNLAPFVEHGSYLEMVGEDDHRWRWVFWRGELREEHPVITWPYESITAVGELVEGFNG